MTNVVPADLAGLEDVVVTALHRESPGMLTVEDARGGTSFDLQRCDPRYGVESRVSTIRIGTAGKSGAVGMCDRARRAGQLTGELNPYTRSQPRF
jgi:hypothetical protein